jgi:hypothetical protein
MQRTPILPILVALMTLGTAIYFLYFFKSDESTEDPGGRNSNGNSGGVVVTNSDCQYADFSTDNACVNGEITQTKLAIKPTGNGKSCEAVYQLPTDQPTDVTYRIDPQSQNVTKITKCPQDCEYENIDNVEKSANCFEIDQYKDPMYKEILHTDCRPRGANPVSYNRIKTVKRTKAPLNGGKTCDDVLSELNQGDWSYEAMIDPSNSEQYLVEQSKLSFNIGCPEERTWHITPLRDCTDEEEAIAEANKENNRLNRQCIDELEAVARDNETNIDINTCQYRPQLFGMANSEYTCNAQLENSTLPIACENSNLNLTKDKLEQYANGEAIPIGTYDSAQREVIRQIVDAYKKTRSTECPIGSGECPPSSAKKTLFVEFRDINDNDGEGNDATMIWAPTINKQYTNLRYENHFDKVSVHGGKGIFCNADKKDLHEDCRKCMEFGLDYDCDSCLRHSVDLFGGSFATNVCSTVEDNEYLTLPTGGTYGLSSLNVISSDGNGYATLHNSRPGFIELQDRDHVDSDFKHNVIHVQKADKLNWHRKVEEVHFPVPDMDPTSLEFRVASEGQRTHINTGNQVRTWLTDGNKATTFDTNSDVFQKVNDGVHSFSMFGPASGFPISWDRRTLYQPLNTVS